MLTMGLTDEQVVDMQMWWEKANEGALASWETLSKESAMLKRFFGAEQRSKRAIPTAWEKFVVPTKGTRSARHLELAERLFWVDVAKTWSNTELEKVDNLGVMYMIARQRGVSLEGLTNLDEMRAKLKPVKPWVNPAEVPSYKDVTVGGKEGVTTRRGAAAAAKGAGEKEKGTGVDGVKPAEAPDTVAAPTTTAPSKEKGIGRAARVDAMQKKRVEEFEKTLKDFSAGLLSPEVSTMIEKLVGKEKEKEKEVEPRPEEETELAAGKEPVALFGEELARRRAEKRVRLFEDEGEGEKGTGGDEAKGSDGWDRKLWSSLDGKLADLAEAGRQQMKAQKFCFEMMERLGEDSARKKEKEEEAGGKKKRKVRGDVLGFVSRVKKEGGVRDLERMQWREQHIAMERSAKVSGGSHFCQLLNTEVQKRFRIMKRIQERKWEFEDKYGENGEQAASKEDTMEHEAGIRERELEIAMIVEGMSVLRQSIKLDGEGQHWVAKDLWDEYVKARDEGEDDDLECRDLIKESKKRYRDERAIQRDNFIDQQRRGGNGDRVRQRTGDDDRQARGGRGQDEDRQRQVGRNYNDRGGDDRGQPNKTPVRVNWVKAEDVFPRRDVKDKGLEGKYVSVVAKDSQMQGKFMKRKLSDVGPNGRGGDGGFPGTCYECGKQGHQTFQCPEKEVMVDGKKCVTSAELYAMRLVDETGRARY